jgi:polysaccharide biosynthesis protein PslF
VSVSYGFLSTYSPARDDLADLTAALLYHLTAAGDQGGVVRVVGNTEPVPGVAVLGHLIAGSRLSTLTAAAQLNRQDVAVIQHEYSIYEGLDGDRVLDMLALLTVPSIVVLHSVPEAPTAHQRLVLERAVGAADAVVVTSAADAARLRRDYTIGSSKIIEVIAHEPDVAADAQRQPAPLCVAPAGPTILSWGPLRPGTGLEWTIDALGELRDLAPAPTFLIAGRAQPEFPGQDASAYRMSLIERAAERGVSSLVRFDPSYQDTQSLQRLIDSADAVVMPFDSQEYVASGVLVEAAAVLRPVMTTRLPYMRELPHMRELLATGGAPLVEHHDAAAVAAALRSVLAESGPAADTSAAATRLTSAPGGAAAAERYHALAESLLAARATAEVPARAA